MIAIRLRALRSAALASLVLLLSGLLAACGEPDEDEAEPFSVTFSLESVPGDLTLDSLEVEIAVGDTGLPRAFTVDLKSGVSRAQILSYPGQRYALTYALYASGYDIGRGRDSGVFAADMRLVLQPRWSAAKVEAARALRASGLLLPPSLAQRFGTAVAGREMDFGPDSAAGRDYAWYVRRGDSILASGTGARLRWTPPAPSPYASVNVKFVVKDGNRILEERDWDVALLPSLPDRRVTGVVTRNHPSASIGTYTRIRYGGHGRVDSVIVYDTIHFVPGLKPSTTVAYEYASGSQPARVSAARRRGAGFPSVDSLFAYDALGRLVALTVQGGGRSSVDSLLYLPGGPTVIRSFLQGALRRVVHRHDGPDSLHLDSIFAPADGGLALSGLVETLRDGAGREVGRRIHRQAAGSLELVETETVQYNALGLIDVKRTYRAGGSLVLDRSETYEYRSQGILERVTALDDGTGDYLEVRNYFYDSDPKALAKRADSGAAIRSAAAAGLALLARHFPLRPADADPTAARPTEAKEAP